MKIISAIIIVLMFACAGFSQTFAPAAEEFSVNTPLYFSGGIPVDPAQLPPGIPKPESQRYFAKSGSTYFFIFSDPLKKKVQEEFVLDFIKRAQGEITSQKVNDLQTARLQGDYYEFATTDGFYHRVLIVETASRAYIFQTTGEIKDDEAANSFFGGISISGTTFKPTRIISDKPTVKTQERTIAKNSGQGSGQGTGSGTGSGSGVGSGSGIGTGSGSSNPSTSAAQPAPQKQIIPFKILTKPRANYTDSARFYQMTGNVRVRVVFGADGKITSVAPISRLPFGLTKEALEAAKLITFTPMTVDGQPVSVTKVVEYNFLIY